MTNHKLWGVAADLVYGPVDDSLIATEPWHDSFRRGLTETADCHHYFAPRVNCGSHNWKECYGTTWRTQGACLDSTAKVNKAHYPYIMWICYELKIENLLAVILHLFCSTGCSAMHWIVFPFRLSDALTVKLKFPAPLLELLSSGKDSWACGVPPTHPQWYCRLMAFTDCTEHSGLPTGRSVPR